MGVEYLDEATGDRYRVEVQTHRPVCIKIEPSGTRSDIDMIHQIPPSIRPDILAEQKKIFSVGAMPPKHENPSLVHYVIGGCGHNRN